jgi:hypothetical protein
MKWVARFIPVAALCFIVWLAFYLSADVNRYKKACAAQGGHIVKLGRASVCLTPDGRIMEHV